MRRIVLALAGTVSGLVMLFSYHTSLAGGGVVAAPGTRRRLRHRCVGRHQLGSSGGTDARPGGSSTVTGDTVQTRWGPVQVQITVEGGQLTDVTAVQYPNGNGRDQEINAYALPVLAQEALAAQSADIDHVSGATVTSEGYVQSLQSALDQANL